jgi:hypothetical protein
MSLKWPAANEENYYEPAEVELTNCHKKWEIKFDDKSSTKSAQGRLGRLKHISTSVKKDERTHVLAKVNAALIINDVNIKMLDENV